MIVTNNKTFFCKNIFPRLLFSTLHLLYIAEIIFSVIFAQSDAFSYSFLLFSAIQTFELKADFADSTRKHVIFNRKTHPRTYRKLY